MRGLRAAGLLFLVLGACGGGSSAGLAGPNASPFAAFGAPSLAGAPFPRELTIGWFDEDAYPDVATVDIFEGTVRILLGQAGGGFELRAPVSFGIPPPHRIASGFFDLDAFQDLVVIGFGDFSVLLGNGDGTFAPAQGSVQPLAPGLEAGEIAVGACNPDSFDDVAYGTSDGHVGIALSTGAGTFLPGGSVALPSTSVVVSIALHDLDGDGDLDVVALQSDSQLSVLAGDGAGGLSLASPPLLIGGTPRQIVVGFFDLLNGSDVAVLDEVHRQVRIYSGGPGPSLTQPPIASISLPQNGLSITRYPQTHPTKPNSLVVTTYDGDDFTSGHLLFISADDTTGIWGSRDVPSGLHLLQDVAVADVDLDGRSDLIVAAGISESFILDGLIRALRSTGP